MFIPGRRAEPRRFVYEPRYYNPTKDDRLRRRIRIKSNVRRGRHASFLWLGFLLFFALFIYWQLG